MKPISAAIIFTAIVCTSYTLAAESTVSNTTAPTPVSAEQTKPVVSAQPHKPKNTDVYVEYLSNIADYNGESAVFESSLTSQQRQIKENRQKYYDKIVALSSKLCEPGEKLVADNPTHPMCVDNTPATDINKSTKEPTQK